MIRRSPRAGASLVGGDGNVLLALVGNFEDVRQWRRTATAHSARSPGARFPCHELAVFVGGNLYPRKAGWTHARDFLFGIALQHDLHRLAASGLRELRGCDSPTIRAELAAESAADVLLQHLNISRRDPERFRDLGSNAGEILRGNMHHKVLVA